MIGMEEGKATQPRVASQLDGVEFGPGNAIQSPEQFQQIVDSCVSPFSCQVLECGGLHSLAV